MSLSHSLVFQQDILAVASILLLRWKWSSAGGARVESILRSLEWLYIQVLGNYKTDGTTGVPEETKCLP